MWSDSVWFLIKQKFLISVGLVRFNVRFDWTRFVCQRKDSRDHTSVVDSREREREKLLIDSTTAVLWVQWARRNRMPQNVATCGTIADWPVSTERDHFTLLPLLRNRKEMYRAELKEYQIKRERILQQVGSLQADKHSEKAVTRLWINLFPKSMSVSRQCSRRVSWRKTSLGTGRKRTWGGNTTMSLSSSIPSRFLQIRRSWGLSLTRTRLNQVWGCFCRTQSS